MKEWSVKDLLRKCLAKLESKHYTCPGKLFLTTAMIRNLIMIDTSFLFSKWRILYAKIREQVRKCRQRELFSETTEIKRIATSENTGLYSKIEFHYMELILFLDQNRYRIDSTQVLCYACGLRNFKELAYQFRRDIPKSELPPEVTARSDCYWGRNCRTARNKPHHAQYAL